MQSVLYLPCTPVPITERTSESLRAKYLAVKPEDAPVRIAVMYVASIMTVGNPAWHNYGDFSVHVMNCTTTQ